ncbi:MAG: hypothetical protein Q9159_005903 [Coniocarpon cinnabarinum]
MLRKAGVRTGRFTSPHLIDRWDGITINDRVVDQRLFEDAEGKVKRIDQQNDIGASSFELLTATAFQVFNETNVDMAVIECGMGGREDATNVLRDPVVSVITSIGRDHQEYLGNTIEEIALNKAGILKPGVPLVMPNYPKTMEHAIASKTLRIEANRIGALHAPMPRKLHVIGSISAQVAEKATQMKLATKAVELASASLARSGNAYFAKRPDLETVRKDLNPVMLDVVFPGRMQLLSIQSLTGRQNPVLVDGAHNLDAWQMLQRQVNNNWPAQRDPKSARVTWVFAQSSNEHKSPREMIETLCQHGDSVFATDFGPVDGMPWIKPAGAEAYGSPEDLKTRLRKFNICHSQPLDDVLRAACEEADGGPLVVTGSLYLVSDLMRLLRDAGHDPRNVKD